MLLKIFYLSLLLAFFYSCMYSDKESTNTLALKLDSVQTLLDSVLKRIPVVETTTISKKKDTLIKQKQNQYYISSPITTITKEN
jgi:hypothetical protein